MPRTVPPRPIVIDARPRGPHGPLAVEPVLGRPILVHLLDAASYVSPSCPIHARVDEHAVLRAACGPAFEALNLTVGPPPQGAAVLRVDRIYDARRLRGVLLAGKDPEKAVVWRLDTAVGLAGAEAELLRRTTYQPLGRYWAYRPATRLAEALKQTPVRPNHVTLLASTFFLAGALGVALGTDLAVRIAAAAALATALILDTADGRLARLQGTSSDFGRMLDGWLDEVGDMALHLAAGWSAFRATGAVAWLLAAFVYASGKYLFFAATRECETPADKCEESTSIAGVSPLRSLVRNLGHADIRWHGWIVAAACGWMRWELAAFAVYYPLRALAVVVRRGLRDAS